MLNNQNFNMENHLEPSTSGKPKPKREKNKSKKSLKRKKSLFYMKVNKKGAVNSFSKIQLSILNTGLIPTQKIMASGMVPKKPLDLEQFKKRILLLRKYEVLFKIEFNVSQSISQLIDWLLINN